MIGMPDFQEYRREIAFEHCLHASPSIGRRQTGRALILVFQRAYCRKTCGGTRRVTAGVAFG